MWHVSLLIGSQVSISLGQEIDGGLLLSLVRSLIGVYHRERW